MKKAKLLSCLLAISLIAASLGACGKEETGEVSVLQNRKETMAKVVSLDGDQITVILADTPEKDGTPSDEVSSATTTAVRTSQRNRMDNRLKAEDLGAAAAVRLLKAEPLLRRVAVLLRQAASHQHQVLL